VFFTEGGVFFAPQYFCFKKKMFEQYRKIVALKGLIKKEFSLDNMISTTKNNDKPQIIEKKYEIRIEDIAIDVQVREER
jgi:hypothetical protein